MYATIYNPGSIPLKVKLSEPQKLSVKMTYFAKVDDKGESAIRGVVQGIDFTGVNSITVHTLGSPKETLDKKLRRKMWIERWKLRLRITRVKRKQTFVLTEDRSFLESINDKEK